MSNQFQANVYIVI